MANRGRPRKDAAYQQALVDLRAKHADKLESIFLTMYGIIQGDSEDKDKVNASKVVVSLLGVPKPGAEKPRDDKKDNPTASQDKPVLTKEHRAMLDDIIGEP